MTALVFSLLAAHAVRLPEAKANILSLLSISGLALVMIYSAVIEWINFIHLLRRPITAE